MKRHAWMLKLVLLGVALSAPEWAFAADVATDKSASQVATDVSGSLIKVTVGLLFVVAAIFASAWVFRRIGNFQAVPNEALRVIGGLTMGNRERIVLLQVGDEQILVGVSPGRMQTLHKLETPIEITPQRAGADSFTTKFNSALKHWKSKQV